MRSYVKAVEIMQQGFLQQYTRGPLAPGQFPNINSQRLVAIKFAKKQRVLDILNTWAPYADIVVWRGFFADGTIGFEADTPTFYGAVTQPYVVVDYKDRPRN